MTADSFQERFDSDCISKISSDLCIPLSQSDAVLVHVKLPNNDTLSTKFAFQNTILDVKRYVLPALQLKIENIQQIRCVFCDGNRQFEKNDHTLLKYYWDNRPLQILVNIEHHEEIKNTSHVSNTIVQRNADHPAQGKILDTNVILPKNVSGYRNKNTGKFYKNTMVQTSSKPDLNYQNKMSLAIQTTSTQVVTTEVSVECGTQTQSMDILRSLNIVREISLYRKINSNPNENRDKYARVLQNSVRKWMARKKFENMLKYYNYLKSICDEEKNFQKTTLEEEKNLKNVIYNEHRKMIINLQYPTKTRDFKALYSIVHENYKRARTKIPKPTKIEQFEEKLASLREIEKRRNQAKEIAGEKKIFRQLNDIAKPIEKIRKTGEIIYIETPDTYQAKQFMDLYAALRKNVSSKAERIVLLLKLRETLERFKEVELTKSLIDLISRELTILNVIQLDNDQLKILRKRIEIEFQWILKQPDINPAIARTSKITVLLTKCYSCRRLKSLNKYSSSLHLTKPTVCNNCKYLNHITTEQINLIPYKNILKNIKISEAKMSVKFNFAFLLIPEDIYYLVTIIWKAQSAISGSNDMLLLRLERWHIKNDWSPSNTILLTIEEAYNHSKISDINKEYSIEFIKKVHQKHAIANNYFSV